VDHQTIRNPELLTQRHKEHKEKQAIGSVGPITVLGYRATGAAR
jgi:hypothetical protein